MAQRLKDVHDASGTQLLLWQTAVKTWRDVPHQSDACPRCCSSRSNSSSARRGRHSVTTLVRSTDASDWLVSYGLSAQHPMTAQSVWCDVPPRQTVSEARPLIGPSFIQRETIPAQWNCITPCRVDTCCLVHTKHCLTQCVLCISSKTMDITSTIKATSVFKYVVY